MKSREEIENAIARISDNREWIENNWYGMDRSTLMVDILEWSLGEVPDEEMFDEMPK